MFRSAMALAVLASAAMLCGCQKTVVSSAGASDGFINIACDSELSQRAKISIIEVHPDGQTSNVTVVDVAVENDDAVPLRLLCLGGLGNCVLVDKQGFIHSAYSTPPQEFIALPRGKSKLRLTFDGYPAQAATLRLYNHDYPIPGDVIRE